MHALVNSSLFAEIVMRRSKLLSRNLSTSLGRLIEGDGLVSLGFCYEGRPSQVPADCEAAKDWIKVDRAVQVQVSQVDGLSQPSGLEDVENLDVDVGVRLLFGDLNDDVTCRCAQPDRWKVEMN